MTEPVKRKKEIMGKFRPFVGASPEEVAVTQNAVIAERDATIAALTRKIEELEKGCADAFATIMREIENEDGFGDLGVAFRRAQSERERLLHPPPVADEGL